MLSRFRKNLNLFDRTVRLVVGAVCIYVGFIDANIVGNDLVSVLIGLFGVINIFATLSSHCPIYAACGVSTYPKHS